MKLITNFALPVRKILLSVFLLSIVISLTSLTIAYLLGRDRADLLNESEKLSQVAKALSDKFDSTGTGHQHNLTANEIASVRTRIETLNTHTPIKGVSVNRLLDAIEDLLPEGVTVNRLGYSVIDGQINLVAETDEPDRIYLFMKRLEQSTLFESPLLQQQPGISDGAQNLTQYEIHVVAKKI